MEMTLRWYGSQFDTVTLEQIRQIPGVTGVITTLYDTQPGEVWCRERIRELKHEVEAAGLHIAGIESVNVHDAIKIGAPERELYIENYIKTLENLGKEGIHLVCYNFMPVFDWTRTELARKRADGSTVLAYTQEAVDALKPEEMFRSIAGETNGAVMPGWEPERMAKIKELFASYQNVDEEKLFENLGYFLERIMPVCDRYDINMAIHPDDPAWSVFGLPRIVINKENILRIMTMVDNPHNGVTFCSGSYGTNLDNDLPDMIRSLKGRIHFAHVRNLKFHSPTNFEEAAHLSTDGTFDMYEIMKALYDIGFDGPIRPDHGRMIWGEVAMPGYGLYDRALGATYLNGLWEAIEKANPRQEKLWLNDTGIKKRELWRNKGYHCPSYDREEMKKKTQEQPYWIHFGAGNIFRAFQANIAQRLLEHQVMDRGILVAEGYDLEILDQMNRVHDDLSILVTLKSNGTVEKTVVGSVANSYSLDASRMQEFEQLKQIFEKDSLQMASFTITEKGYRLRDASGEFYPEVCEDMKHGPTSPSSYPGKVVSLLYQRFLSGQKPIAMVSMDNCSHNGDKLKSAVLEFAKVWEEQSLVKEGFFQYVNDSRKVSFPWTMIDKITPRPDPSVEAMLRDDGVQQTTPIVTQKHSYLASFVNAEECEYLVIEDAFPNGRPPLDKAGVMFASKETVEKVERMKVCTCLNPLHTALAVFGCLLGYDRISEEMKDTTLKKLVEIIGYDEGLPVVINPGIINPKEFIDTVVNCRIPNPFLPDTPQRIATDTSQKLAIRYGETIKSYLNSDKRNVQELKAIPLVLAGWIRYLMAIDDRGQAFELSPDPLIESVRPYISTFELGAVKEEEARRQLKPLLEETTIFGVNLCEIGMADLICNYFVQMAQGVGAVRDTLEHVIE